MKKNGKRVCLADENSCVAEKKRVKQAEARAIQAETRTEQAKTRIEHAEARTEKAETRTELAKTRAEFAEARAEQAEMALQSVIQKEVLMKPASARLLQDIVINGDAKTEPLLEKLTDRQREVLRLIAEGRNTKQIGDILKISPKTVEYHRTKLMKTLKLHDVPGLVRFALCAGLVPLKINHE